MRNTLTIILLITTFVCFGVPLKVTRIIDGDTFEVETGEKVRLIGINAPEISDIYGQESKEHLSMLVNDKVVELINDNFSSDKDRYQRLLRYVVLNGVDINKKMISDGFAFAYLKYHFSKSNEYKQSQLDAQETNIGIWSSNKIEKNIVQQNEKKTNILSIISPKIYFIGGVVFFLMLIGLYFYYKK